MLIRSAVCSKCREVIDLLHEEYRSFSYEIPIMGRSVKSSRYYHLHCYEAVKLKQLEGDADAARQVT